MSNVINMGGGGMDLVTGTLKSGSHVIYSDGDASHDEIPTADKSAQVLGNSIVYAPFGLTGGATAMSQAGFWLVTDDFTALEASATASTTPKSGVTYTNGISDLTPDILSKFAAAISNNADITYDTETVYCDLSSYHRKITVGDTVPISMDDRVHDFRIVGFNTEQLTDSAAYGSVTYTGKAGIVFDMVDVYSTAYPVHNETIGLEQTIAWENLAINKTVLPSLEQKLPSSWRTCIKPVTHTVMTLGWYTVSNAYSGSERLFIPAWTNLLSYANSSSDELRSYCSSYGSRAPDELRYLPTYKYWNKIYSSLSSKPDIQNSFRKKNGPDTASYWIKGWLTPFSASTSRESGMMYVADYSSMVLCNLDSIGKEKSVSFCFCL